MVCGSIGVRRSGQKGQGVLVTTIFEKNKTREIRSK
jgi:hypothetical protein